MRRQFNTSMVIAALVLSAAASLGAAPDTLTVAVDKPGHAISPTLYGIFFEDINCSADGGIYAEMINTAIGDEAVLHMILDLMETLDTRVTA